MAYPIPSQAIITVTIDQNGVVNKDILYGDSFARENISQNLINLLAAIDAADPTQTTIDT